MDDNLLVWHKYVRSAEVLKIIDEHGDVKVCEYNRDNGDIERIAIARDISDLVDFVKEFRSVPDWQFSTDNSIALAERKDGGLWYGGSSTNDFLNREIIGGKEYWTWRPVPEGGE